MPAEFNDQFVGSCFGFVTGKLYQKAFGWFARIGKHLGDALWKQPMLSGMQNRFRAFLDGENEAKNALRSQ